MQFELEIVKFTPPGDGLGYYNGKTVFVPATMPGDTVRVFSLKERKQSITAALQEILVPSPQRCDPPCPHYQDCGGCSLMHLTYSRQLEMKQQMLQEVLRKNGFDLEPVIVPSQKNTHFRFKSRVRCVDGKLGFSERKSNRVVEIPHCRILSPGIMEALKQLSRQGRSTAEFQLLESQNTGQVAVSIQEGRRMEPLPGFPQSLEEDYGYGPLTLHSHGFAQSNPFITRDIIRDLLLTTQDARKICELFCGCGTFSLPLTTNVEHLNGIDVSNLSIQTAINNAKQLNQINCDFKPSDLNHIRKLPPADTVVADPPRKGLGSQLCQMINQSKVEKMVYISCNPATMTRDLQELTRTGGFTINSLKGYDMYCHTTHLEAMTVLTR